MNVRTHNRSVVATGLFAVVGAALGLSSMLIIGSVFQQGVRWPSLLAGCALAVTTAMLIQLVRTGPRLTASAVASGLVGLWGCSFALTDFAYGFPWLGFSAFVSLAVFALVASVANLIRTHSYQFTTEVAVEATMLALWAPNLMHLLGDGTF